MVTVLIDNCAWDRLWERNVHLPDEQGNDLHFSVSNLGLIEIPSIDHSSEKAIAVGLYARNQLAQLESQPVVWFGFQAEDGKSPALELLVTSNLMDLSWVVVFSPQ